MNKKYVTVIIVDRKSPATMTITIEYENHTQFQEAVDDAVGNSPFYKCYIEFEFDEANFTKEETDFINSLI